MPTQETFECNDERTPLLPEREYPTPLPTGQMFSLLLLMIAEPVMSVSIMPYITEVRSSFHLWLWPGVTR
jgi:hypothetical protein